MYITLFLTTGRIHLGPHSLLPLMALDDAGGGTPSRYPVFTEEQARAFLYRHFGNAVEIGRLRSLLARDAYNVTRMKDGQIVVEAARRLSNGNWIVTEARHEEYSRTVAIAAPTQAVRTTAAVRPAPVSTKPAAPVAKTGKPAPAPGTSSNAVRESADFSDHPADQIGQARTLREAAKTGVPFCEVCEAARKAREAAAA